MMMYHDRAITEFSLCCCLLQCLKKLLLQSFAAVKDLEKRTLAATYGTYLVRVNLTVGWMAPKAEHFIATALSGARRGTDTMIDSLPLEVFVKALTPFCRQTQQEYLPFSSLRCTPNKNDQ
jgi:hypothetical protein